MVLSNPTSNYKSILNASVVTTGGKNVNNKGKSAIKTAVSLQNKVINVTNSDKLQEQFITTNTAY